MGHASHSSLDDFDAAAARFEHAYWAVSLGDASSRTADLDAFANAMSAAEDFFAAYLVEQAAQQEQLVEKTDMRLGSASLVPDWEISRKLLESDWRVDCDWRALTNLRPATLSPLALTPLSSNSDLLLFGNGTSDAGATGQICNANNLLLMTPDCFACGPEYDFSSVLESDIMFVEPTMVTENVVAAKAAERDNSQRDHNEHEDEFVDVETVDDNDAPVYEVKDEPVAPNAAEDGGVACVPSQETARGPKPPQLLLPLPTAAPRPHFVIEGGTRARHLAPNVNMQGVPDSASVSCLPPQQGPPMLLGGQAPHPYMRSLGAAVEARMLASGRASKGGEHRPRRGELKRLSHNTLEKRRREDLRVVQDALKASLPLADQAGVSQLCILSKAVEHLKGLRAENERLVEERRQQLELKEAQERRLRELREALGLADADV